MRSPPYSGRREDAANGVPVGMTDSGRLAGRTPRVGKPGRLAGRDMKTARALPGPSRLTVPYGSPPGVDQLVGLGVHVAHDPPVHVAEHVRVQLVPARVRHQ